MAQTIFKAEFDMVLKISTNKIYSGIHWRRRMDHKKQYAWEVIRVIQSQKLKPVNAYPVILSFRFIFQKQPFDSSNCGYMAKLIEDALVSKGILKDDTPKFVSEVRLNAEKRPKNQKNKIELEVIYGEPDEDQRRSEDVPEPRKILRPKSGRQSATGGQNQQSLF